MNRTREGCGGASFGHKRCSSLAVHLRSSMACRIARQSYSMISFVFFLQEKILLNGTKKFAFIANSFSAANASCQVHVFFLDRDSFGVHRTEVGIFEQGD